MHPSTGTAFCTRCGAWRGSLGLEPDYRLYVDHLVAVMREVRRVLRARRHVVAKPRRLLCDRRRQGASAPAAARTQRRAAWQGGVPATQPNRMPQPGLKPKDLVGIPWRVAFALQDDGWWLRRDHVWAKPNPMPELVRDRCTTAHEYLFLLTKSARYYYDADAIKEPFATITRWAIRCLATTPRGARTSPLSRRPRLGESRGSRRFRQGPQQALGLDDCNAAVPGRAFCDVSAGADRAVHPRRLPGGRHGARPVSRRRDDGAGRRSAGRHSIGVELSPAYAAMARDRIGGPKLARAAA